ncbi:MAG: 3'-5' exonuclease [Flavobacteriales bacterium]
MLKDLNIENVLFLDIETVPAEEAFSNLDEGWQVLWEEKSRFYREKEEVELSDSYQRAGIYAEFGKIVCISVGYIRQKMGEKTLRVTSFYSDDEKELLVDFSNLLEQHFNKPYHLLCAHNGKEFDFPFIARRMIINGLALPELLDSAGKKPWEIKHLDTMELWKFGDFKAYTSLRLLTKVFGIPTPKDDIDGSQVAQVYHEEKDLERIERYCKKDVVALVQLMMKYKGEELIEEVVEV